MRAITILDTAIATKNIGDEIIMEAVSGEMATLAPEFFRYRVPTHDVLGSRSRELLRASELAILGGTNILNSRLWRSPTWRLPSWSFALKHKVVLMGVGWYQYQRSADFISRAVLRRVLHPRLLHSVRDGYTQEMLRKAGVSNVVMTGCPTTWRLTPSHCAKIPREQASQVLCTLNSGLPRPEEDRRMIRFLRDRYSAVFCWGQAPKDYAYAAALDSHLKMVPPTLAAFDQVMSANTIDYVGTRLHGGVRALQHGCRTIVVAIDNRATEMARHLGLRVVARGDQEALSGAVLGDWETRLSVPEQALALWRSQF